jgi:uncharacterized protein (TIGR03083 family)
MSTSTPILVVPLFREVCQHLHALLRSLSPEDWQQPTISSQRCVKDIASHLLDGSLRRISMQRDGYFPPDAGSRPSPEEPLQAFLNRLNRDWEVATRRLSPPVLIEWLQWVDSQLADLFESFDPHGPAIFPVAWAGEQQSENWFDIAREYTEKWHHTQQIFEAVGRPSTITTRRLYYPCLDIFMRALPFTLGSASAEVGEVVRVDVVGDAGGTWAVERAKDGWCFTPDAGQPTATVSIPQQFAWKWLTKRRAVEQIRASFPEIRISGDESLGQQVLTMVSVMA